MTKYCYVHIYVRIFAWDSYIGQGIRRIHVEQLFNSCAKWSFPWGNRVFLLHVSREFTRDSCSVCRRPFSLVGWDFSSFCWFFLLFTLYWLFECSSGLRPSSHSHSGENLDRRHFSVRSSGLKPFITHFKVPRNLGVLLESALADVTIIRGYADCATNFRCLTTSSVCCFYRARAFTWDENRDFAYVLGGRPCSNCSTYIYFE
jgi:hypothetical protein